MRLHVEGGLLLVVSLVLAESVQADEDCKPTPGEKPVRLDQCCKITTEIVPTSMVTKFQKCVEKYSATKHPKGSSPSGPTPDLKRDLACVKECMFAKEGLLTSDNNLDTAAVAEYFSSTDADLNTVVKSAVNECLQTYQRSLNSSLECTSGAVEFEHCVGREVFQNCPKTMWETTPECEALKAKAIKCQMIHFLIKKSVRP